MKTKVIIAGVATILCVGALVIVALSIAVWEIRGITDAPWWVGSVIFAFLYMCALPGLLLPYCYFAKRLGKSGSRSILSSVLVAVAYPCALVTLTYLGGLVLGTRQMEWDKLVESVHGWLILIVMTLGSGVLLSYASIRLDAKCCS